MAKHKPRKSRSKSASKGHPIANHKYEKRDFHCYGKRVKKRGGGTTPRIFCGKLA